jgi:homoserine dehydrogenase
MNAILVNGDAVGNTLYYGAGAGAEPTGSAVCADIIDIACGNTRAKQIHFTETQNFSDIGSISSAYYLRVQAKEQMGVLADISKSLTEQNINIEGLYQQEVQDDDESVPVVIITQSVKETAINKAIEKIKALGCTEGDVVKIRIEHFKI